MRERLIKDKKAYKENIRRIEQNMLQKPVSVSKDPQQGEGQDGEMRINGDAVFIRIGGTWKKWTVKDV